MVGLYFAALGTSVPLFAEAEPLTIGSSYRKSRIILAQAETTPPPAQGEALPAETPEPAPETPPAAEAQPDAPAADARAKAPATPTPETGGAVEMDRIQVEGAEPTHQTAQRTPARSRSAPKPALMRQARVEAPPPPADIPVEPLPPTDGAIQETAEGPVQGYVATRSTTATKTDTPLALTPQSVSVVTADQIRDRAATTLDEALAYTPGLYATPYGFDGRGNYQIIRGTFGTQYLDGLSRSYYFYDFGKPDTYNLERVEVLRGPSSMLYGQNASGGLVNSISKRPQARPYREVGVQFGDFDRAQIQTDMTGPLTEDGKWLYRLVAVGRDAETQLDFSKDDHRLIAPSLTWQPSSRTNVTLLGLYQDDDASPSTLQFAPREGTLVPGPNGRISRSLNPSNPDFDYYETLNQSVTGLVDHQFTDWLGVHANIRYTDLEVEQGQLYPNIFGVPDPYIDPQRRQVTRIVSNGSLGGDILTADTNAGLKFRSGPIEHKVLAGYDYSRYDALAFNGFDVDLRPFDLYDPVYTTTTAPALLPSSDVTQYQRGYYIQDQFRLGPFLATIGGRYDELTNKDQFTQISQISTATTHRYALLYESSFGFNPYVAYSEAFQPVIGASRTGQFFKPVEGESVEVGFKYKSKSGLMINGAAYQIDEQNRLSSDPNDPLNQLQLGEVRIEGYEIEAGMSVTDQFDVIASYSYTDAVVTEGDNIGLVPEAVPDHLASLWGVYRFSLFGRTGFSVGAGVRYVGETGNTTFETDPYTLFDAMAGYESDRWRWMVNGNNLEDEKFVTACRFPTGPDCWFGQRRTVTTTLTYKF